VEGKAKDAPRLAASSYLNTAPLIWSFLEGSMRHGVELLTHDAPARCAQRLDHAEVDAALVPVIEYQRMPEIAVVPGVCVGARARVGSVVLVTQKHDLRDVRVVSLDTSSRTSVALVRILFCEFMGFEPEWKEAEPDLQAMLRASDAALMIGDPAMTFPRGGLHVYDLASLWREQTGLGFVFAMWMVRGEALRSARAVDFARARDEGLAHVEEIAAHYQSRLGLSRNELRAYLLENICFEPDAEMLAGLELFYKLAYRHGLIESLKPIEWAVE
jgi:chorismate dehydratase